MDQVKQLIQQIHDSPPQAVVAVAGAGTQAVAWLLAVAGASRTILEVVVPYGRLSMVELLGSEPAQFVSTETALAMAHAAYKRAGKLRESDIPVLGLGATATIATDRVKRGEHRCHLAVWGTGEATAYDLRLAKDFRDRAGEEDLVSRLVVHALARASGIDPGKLLDLSIEDSLSYRTSPHPSLLHQLLAGTVESVTVLPGGEMVDTDDVPALILPGSFSPLHHGHEELARVAAGILHTEAAFELSVTNVDKPQLDDTEVLRRSAQFAGKAKIVLTRADTFRKKADLFPGSTFVIGWDTAVRLVAPRYYGGSENTMLTALAEIAAAGCRFLVAGREDNGTFRTLEDVPVPGGFWRLFHGIPETVFREDVSSTALRAAG